MSVTFSVVLFDVDGTIVDSAPAVMGAFRAVLSDFNLPV
ncbi:HAD hydrolase-like protein, partial [Salmonella enterica subsp. enterica serovar Enteritidis]|nr:HAD hydrolase-like protein [Salmonella enterica subsp. enterica serovar Enteritidis]